MCKNPNQLRIGHLGFNTVFGILLGKERIRDGLPLKDLRRKFSWLYLPYINSKRKSMQG